MNEYSESQKIAHSIGMKARLIKKNRSTNPYEGGRGEFDFEMCAAWFAGWDAADKGLRPIGE